jgi:hypothetical protein
MYLAMVLAEILFPHNDEICFDFFYVMESFSYLQGGSIIITTPSFKQLHVYLCIHH